MKLLIGIAIFLLLGTEPALSTPLRWTLNDVLLTDGATATGSFIFDADTLTVSDVNISTSAGSVLAGSAYLGGVNYSQVPSGFWFQFHEGEVITSGSIPTLDIIVMNPLSNEGGTVTVRRINEGFCAWATECSGGTFSRWDTREIAYLSSSVVPIPAAVWLFGSALAALGWFRRRKASLI